MKRKTLPSVFGLLVVLVLIVLSSVCQAAASIAAVHPTSVRQNETLDVKIRGSETHFVTGDSVATFSGNGITVNSTAVVDATHVIANITVEPDAESSARDVNVITGAETPDPLAGGFTVEFPLPTVTGITPEVGVNDGVVDITNLAGTNFRDEAAVRLRKSGETDIVATDVAVVSSEQITCSFDITDADDGHWDVVVENADGESGQLPDGFEVVGSILFPSISLTKTGPDEATPGDTITYTFTVKNTGTDTLFNVGVTDSLLWEGVHPLDPIVQNDTVSFQKNYTIPDSATTSVENNATATATDKADTEVSDTNSHTVFLQTGLVTLLKFGPASAVAGDAVSYDFTVYNNSSEGFTDVSVTDPLFGDDWSYEIGDLASHASSGFSVDYTIPESATIPFTNTATVTATDAFGLQITDTSSYTTMAPSPVASCSSTLIRTTMPPNACWAFLLLAPVAFFGFVRRRQALREKNSGGGYDCP